MPDRRHFLRAAMGASVGVLAKGVPGWPTPRSPGTTSVVAVVRRRSGVFVTLDPRTGEIGKASLPSGTRRVRAHPASASILIELASGSLCIRGNGDSRGDVEVPPIALGSPPLVTADRVIGRDGDTSDVRVHDLIIGDSGHVPDDVLPGTPDSWWVNAHPALPAAVLDARDVGGGVVLLPASAPRAPRVCPAPPGSSVGIAPSGNDIVRIDQLGESPALVCGCSDAATSGRRVPYMMLGEGIARIRGPIATSDNLLLNLDQHELSIVSCTASCPQLVDEMAISGGEDASIGVWRASPDGHALLIELISGGVSAWCWWRIGEDPVMLPALPAGLETGMPVGGSGRWFHGAELSETSLGAGELRLMTVDMETSEVIFDRTVDRRLELAATGASDDGSLLAHCQSGNADIELLVASFGDAATSKQFCIDIEDAPVAAAEIVLDVVSLGESGVVVAGLSWGNHEHHAPIVITTAADSGAFTRPIRIDGELIGVVPAS